MLARHAGSPRVRRLSDLPALAEVAQVRVNPRGMRTTRLLSAVLCTGALSSALACQSPTPAPTVRLVYEMPVDALQRALRGQKDRDLEQVLTETVANVQARLGDDGKVARLAATGFTVDLAKADAAAIASVRRCIETAGKLEMRMLADGEYHSDGVSFDLRAERERLLAWLDAGGRDKLRADGRAIEAFHDDAQAGPLAGKNLRWFVHRIEPDASNVGRWQMAFHRTLHPVCVAAFTADDWKDGAIPAHMQALPAEQQFLVELFAVNMHEKHFDSRDLDPKGLRRVQDAVGEAALQYRIRDAAAYADWSEKYIGKDTTMLWNDEVLSVARFLSRIHGEGQIAGSLSAEQLDAMQRALQAPPLAARPRFVRQEPTGK